MLGNGNKRRNSLSKLAGTIAVITGGNSGIGLSTAERFVAEGAYVYITGRRQKELDAAVTQIGRNVTGVQGDVASLADLDRLYAQVAKEKGHIDVLFANAGIGALVPIDQVTEEHFDKIFNVNAKGLLFTVQKALPLMGKGGSILLNASLASIKGHPNMSVYAATKAAVRSFARTWTLELKDRGIRVNVISPGFTETPLVDTVSMSPEQIAQFKAGTVASIPLGRWANSDEMAKAAVFLASDDSSYIAGIELFVDGGAGQV
jgi:NAD(P)-dependent dehydrogenase (short-subunit alcohol dehydrogenase family)